MFWVVLLAIIGILLTLYGRNSVNKDDCTDRSEHNFNQLNLSESSPDIPKNDYQENTLQETLNDNIDITITSKLYMTEQAKNAMNIHNKYISQSSNPKWHRTQEEKHASDDFYINHQDDIKYYEDKIYNDGTAYNKQISIPDRIYACNKSIEAFYEFQRYCYRSFGGTIYFQNHWEYCHNSKEECFSYVRDLEALLPKLEKLKTLDQDVYDVLENTPEITQTELYKFFDSSLKRKILNILLEWESYGIIKRIKKGNTYLIKLIK